MLQEINNDNQITNNEYVIETPEEVLYLYSSYQLERGAKRYELANHLGNVLTVISDKKTANFTGTTFTNFTAERISATDYSPFGAPLAGRTWNGGEYRFGFNSMEKDNEINGTGNAYDFGARIYYSNLGRFLSIDPKSFQFLSISPYCFAASSPLKFIDENGEGPKDRVLAARQMKGIEYSQNHTTDIKNPFSKESVGKMDCSELVSRVLFADGITPQFQLMDSEAIKVLMSNSKLFEHSNTPKVGDIAIWDGHVAIVTKVGKNGKFSVVMARGEKKKSYEQDLPITAKEYNKSKFHGFYRPKNESPDDGLINDPITGENEGSNSKENRRKSLWEQIVETTEMIIKIIDLHTQDDPYDVTESDIKFKN